MDDIEKEKAVTPCRYVKIGWRTSDKQKLTSSFASLYLIALTCNAVSHYMVVSAFFQSFLAEARHKFCTAAQGHFPLCFGAHQRRTIRNLSSPLLKPCPSGVDGSKRSESKRGVLGAWNDELLQHRKRHGLSVQSGNRMSCAWLLHGKLCKPLQFFKSRLGSCKHGWGGQGSAELRREQRIHRQRKDQLETNVLADGKELPLRTA